MSEALPPRIWAWPRDGGFGFWRDPKTLHEDDMDSGNEFVRMDLVDQAITQASARALLTGLNQGADIRRALVVLSIACVVSFTLGAVLL